MASSSGEEGPRWLYRVCYRGGVHVRQLPALDAPLVDNEVLEFGEEVWAVSSVCSEGIMYVKLADHRGWVFEARGSSDQALQILELLRHEPGHAPSAEPWMPQPAPPDRLLAALGRATCLEDVLLAVRRARPKPTERETLRKLGELAKEAAGADVELLPEALWAVAKLESRIRAALVATMSRQAVARGDNPEAAAVFAALDHRFFNLVDSLVDPGLGHHHELRDLVQAFLVLKVHTTKQPQHTSVARQLSRGFCFDPAVQTPNNKSRAALPCLASFTASFLATGRRCLADPDLQFAWAF